MTSTDSSTNTLARWCFRVPSQRLAEFEATYASKLVPLLKNHDLEESSERGRPTLDVFSRLFAVASPADIQQISESLADDGEWISILTDLGTSYQTSGSDEPLAYSFGLYSTTARPQIVEEEDARWRGHWRHYGREDGFGAGPAFSILLDSRDSSGALTSPGSAALTDSPGPTSPRRTKGPGGIYGSFSKIGRDGCGSVAATGWRATTATNGRPTRQRMADNTVSSILQDRHGNLWVGTGNFFNKGRGVSRHDGRSWISFTGSPRAPVASAVMTDRAGPT